MDPDGSQWIPVDPDGSQWIPMDPDGSQWIPGDSVDPGIRSLPFAIMPVHNLSCISEDVTTDSWVLQNEEVTRVSDFWKQGTHRDPGS